MKQIGVSLPDDLRGELERLAQKEERSVSWIVRDIIQRYFNNRVESDKEIKEEE